MTTARIVENTKKEMSEHIKVDILVGVPRVELGLRDSKSRLLTITTTALADHTPIS